LKFERAEKVPATDKVVSVFEPHTDIIVKGLRDTQFGHKLNLTTGKHGMVLDIVIEEGNPADSSRLLPMIKRIKEYYGKLPRQVAADAGYMLARKISGKPKNWASRLWGDQRSAA